MNKFLFALCLFSSVAFAQRVEITGGSCRYGHSPDGSWWKEGYESSFNLKVPCGSVALSSTPFGIGSYKIGWRLGWNDLGRPKATTKAPVLDEEANSYPTGENCNLLTGSGCVGLYRQTGGAYGASLSAVVERKFGGLTLGGEVGALHYRSWWFVFGEHPAHGTCTNCPPGHQQQYTWDMARGNHTTTLMGLTAEYSGWFLHVRRYSAVYASNAEQNPLYVGLIGGPLVQTTFGYQWKWE
jgi:hypothetical protein